MGRLWVKIMYLYIYRLIQLEHVVCAIDHNLLFSRLQAFAVALSGLASGERWGVPNAVFRDQLRSRARASGCSRERGNSQGMTSSVRYLGP
jgi:hypothetical protein